MLGHQSPKETLETYADLFDSDLDALARVLEKARAKALKPSQAFVDNSESSEENVLGTLDNLA